MSIVESFQARRRGRTTESEDGSIAGILIFCGIGLGLSIFAAFANWIELPAPIF